MKNKIGRLFYIFLLVCIVSIPSIGRVFAASSPIKLSKIEISEKSNDVDATIVSKSNNVVNTDITYHKVNSYIVYKLTFLNTDSKDYSIKSFEDNSNNPYLYYKCEDYKNRIIRAGQTIELNVKETYYKEVDDLDDRSQLSNVKFIFNLVDESGDETITEVVMNPITGDKIFLYMVILAVALTLFLIFLVIKGRKKKKNKTDLLIITIMLLLVPIATKALEVEFDVTLKNAIKLYDKLKVTYTVNGNQSITSSKYGESVTEPRTPYRNGYTFDGWFDGDSLFNFENNITEDVDLEGKYTRETYTITYNLNGGEENTNPRTFTRENLPFSLNAPTKDGYKFIGWTGSNGSTPEEYVYIDEEYQNLEYTAVYEADEYNIYYSGLTEAEENALNNPDTYTAGDVITLNNPSNRKDNYNEETERFVGWEDELGNVSTNVTIQNTLGSVEYEAKWSTIDPTVYNITYNLNGGTVDGTNPLEFTKQTETFTLINPTRTGYTFLGWIGSNGNVPELEVTIEQGTRENLNYEAVFEINNYNITYDLDGGTAVNPDTYTVNDEITLVNPTKRGYTFTGWIGTDIADNSMNVTIPVNSIGDREFTATYEIDTYNITYTLNGGTANNPSTYTVLDNIQLNNPSKTGYTFLGWTNEDITTPQLEVLISDSVGNLNFVANYNAGNYTIHFDKNDDLATGTMVDETMTIDESKKLTKNAFSKTGYLFDGWSTKEDGTGTTYTDEENVTNLITSGTITLFAKWKKISVATFNTGSELNSTMNNLAGSLNIVQKVKYSTTLTEDNKSSGTIVSVDNQSDEPIYMWWDSNTSTIYYGSDANTLYLNKTCSYMFNNMQNVTEIDTNFDTSKCTNMQQMFYMNKKLETITLSNFNTSNVKNMFSMFGHNYTAHNYDINNWDVSNVENFQTMFVESSGITSLDLSNWHTDSATNMVKMFANVNQATSIKIDNFNTSKVNNMEKMFSDTKKLKTLDLSNFDTRKTTSMQQFFQNTYELESVTLGPLFTIENTKNVTKMFQNTGLTTVDISMFNTAKVNTFNNMFDGAHLVTIYVGTGFVTTGQTSNPTMFDGATSLVGGSGTTYSNKTKLYARIDDPLNGNPGYFTGK